MGAAPRVNRHARATRLRGPRDCAATARHVLGEGLGAVEFFADTIDWAGGSFRSHPTSRLGMLPQGTPVKLAIVQL